MEPQAGRYDQPPIFLGDSWSGIPALNIRFDGAPPQVSVVSAKIIFFRQVDGPESPVVTLTETEGITITSAANWEFTIPARELLLPRGEWQQRFSTVDANNYERTWLVSTLTII